MKIRIWGARGSIPAPLTPPEVREKIVAALQGAADVDLRDPIALRNYVDNLSFLAQGTAGGNTACIEIQAGRDLFIIDAGSGIRLLGEELMAGPCGVGQGVIHLFFSHTHWDHIQGLPFFRPAFIAGNQINVYSIHNVSPILADQMKPATFPIPLDYFQAGLRFFPLQEGQSVTIGHTHVSNLQLPHPGHAYAFRFEREGSIFVYASDAEYKQLDERTLQPYLRFYAGADVLIFDAQFSLREAFLKEDWGHSSALIGADLARRAGVRQLVLFHHDPLSSDADLAEMWRQTVAYANEHDPAGELEVVLGREGLEIELSQVNVCTLRHLPEEQTAVLRLVGELDERAVADLNHQLEQLINHSQERPALVVDLEGATRLKIAGLRALIDLRRRWGSEPLLLAAPSGHVQRVIELACYLDYFAIYPTLPAALASLEARRALHLPGQLLKDRYRVESRLGKSEIGNVLKALDTRLGRPVVIKVLSSSFSQVATDRFRREAQEMARLSSPYIITMYDCDEEQGMVYLVMEYVDGLSLERLLGEGKGRKPQPLLATIDVALEILRGLEYAHSKGVVHGNLKPENVLIADNVKLTDFGLRWIEQGRRLTDTALLVGSADYLAPEQIMGQPVEARADLYAFGVILYEMLTGKRPFVAGTTAEILEQHLHQTPLPPRQINPEISRSLEHLILKLLAKEPNQRYSTATQVRRVLMRLERGPLTGTAEDGGGDKSLQHRTRFVGREAQLQRLLHWWVLAQQGQGSIVLISGEAGIGKTRLVEELSSTLSGAAILFGPCSESEESTPFQPFIELIRAYLATTPVAEAKAQLAGSAAVVASLAPEFYTLISNMAPLAQISTAHERLLLMQGFCNFVENATASRPWLMILDDLHWADPSSLQMLQHLARYVGSMPLLIAATYRDVELEPHHPLHDCRRNLSRYQNCYQIRLERLDQHDARDLLHSVWEQEAPEEWVTAIFERTGGNPFYLEEVAKDLSDQGAVVLRDGAWHFAPAIEIKLPARIHDVILRRVARLSPISQDVIRLAAVLGQQFSFTDLTTIAEQPEEQLLESLDELLERDMLHEGEGGSTIVFSHSEIQQIVYEELNPLRRRILHRRVAAALEQAHAGRTEAMAAQLAYHFSEAGNQEKGFLYSLEAARQARALHAYQSALMWYQEAAKLLPGDDGYLRQAIDLYLGLGLMLQAQARLTEASDAFTQMRIAAEGAGDPAAQARAWNRLAESHFRRGDHRQALECARFAEEIARAAGDIAQRDLAEALFRQGWQLAHLGKVKQAFALARRVLAFSKKLGKSARREQALSFNLLAFTTGLLGRHEEAAEYQEQALTLFREIGDHERVGAMLQNLGVNASERGDYFTAVVLYQEALAVQREIGNRGGEMLILCNLGGAHVGMGEFDEAEADLRQLLRMAETSGQLMFLAQSYTYLARACLGQDKITEALQAACYALTLAKAMDHLEQMASAWQALGNVAAHPGAMDAAKLLREEEGSDVCSEYMAFIEKPSTCFAETIRILSELGTEGERARALRDWAYYEINRGSCAEGELLWQEAYHVFSRLNMPLELKRMESLQAPRSSDT
jgi:anti-anti-sigma factor